MQSTSSRNEKCVFITGAGAGIGLATAKLFASKGWFVGIYDCDVASAEAALAAIGADNGRCGILDVRDTESVSRALEDFASHSGGRLDLLVNNAGVLAVDPFEDVELGRHHARIDVNAKGVLNCCHLAFPLLRDTPGAHVVNMASASAGFGVPGFATYSATKFFVRGLTEALDIEWERHDITVSAVWPPFVKTPMVDAVGPNTTIENMGVDLAPEDVAAEIWQAAHGRKTHWPMTRKFRFMRLFFRLTPHSFSRALMKNVTGH